VSTEHLMAVYNRAPLQVERGQGVRLWSTEGVEYLDCVQGISTNGLGHAHPKLVQTVKDQAEKLWHADCAATLQEPIKVSYEASNSRV